MRNPGLQACSHHSNLFIFLGPFIYSIDDATAATSLPAPETPATEGYFTEGNPTAGTPATKVRGSWLNMVQEELRAIVLGAGLTPSETTYTQVYQAILKLSAAQHGFQDFISSGNFNAPFTGTYYFSGCADARMRGCAAGGGAAGSASLTSNVIVAGGSGGGAGQWVFRAPIALTQSQVVPIAIAAPGTAGPISNSVGGGNGGNTTVGTSGSLLTLTGGSGGKTGGGGASTGAYGGQSGGAGFPAGGYGQDTSQYGPGASGGLGAATPFGAPGAPGRGATGGTAVAGGVGTGYGAGGSGAGGFYGTASGTSTRNTGAPGLPGFINIQW